jgi:hypothetical protein
MNAAAIVAIVPTILLTTPSLKQQEQLMGTTMLILV